MSDLIKRMKQACMKFNNDVCMNQSVDDEEGGRLVMHRLTLIFSEDDSDIVSKIDKKTKAMTLYLKPMLTLVSGLESTNDNLFAAAFRVMAREVWWFNQNVNHHETTLAHLMSPESVAAFIAGYESEHRKHVTESN